MFLFSYHIFITIIENAGINFGPPTEMPNLAEFTLELVSLYLFIKENWKSALMGSWSKHTSCNSKNTLCLIVKNILINHQTQKDHFWKSVFFLPSESINVLKSIGNHQFFPENDFTQTNSTLQWNSVKRFKFFQKQLSSSFVISIICLGVSVLALIFSVQYHDEFKKFAALNLQQTSGGYCDQSVTENQCVCFQGRSLQIFKDGFKCKTYFTRLFIFSFLQY